MQTHEYIVAFGEESVNEVAPASERQEKVPESVAPAKAKGTRVKRTESDMLACKRQEGSLAEASYLQNRLVKLEEKIADLFAGVSPEAADLVLSQRGFEHLKRYLP